jgi:hypothetical protein
MRKEGVGKLFMVSLQEHAWSRIENEEPLNWSRKGWLRSLVPPASPTPSFLIIIILNLQPLKLERSPLAFIQYGLMMNVLHSGANIFDSTDNWLVKVLVFRGQETESVENRRGNWPHGSGISRPTEVEQPQPSDVELVSWRRHDTVNGRFNETCWM